jgi:hypothetical protein
MQPGDVRNFSFMVPSLLVDDFREHFEREGIQAECEWWGNQPDSKAEARLKRVWVMRSDGLGPDEILRIRASTREIQFDEFSGTREFEVDGAALLRTAEPELLKRRPRTTRNGWEFMRVGDAKMIRVDRRSLFNALALALIYRRLDWVFRVYREVDMEKRAPTSTPYWTVIRVR